MARPLSTSELEQRRAEFLAWLLEQEAFDPDGDRLSGPRLFDLLADCWVTAWVRSTHPSDPAYLARARALADVSHLVI